jgi:hypothetical protein
MNKKKKKIITQMRESKNCHMTPNTIFRVMCWRRYRWVTSQTRLKPRDYCILRLLIGRKGRDHPSSLHIGKWRSKGPKSLSWMKNLHRFLQCNPCKLNSWYGLWTRSEGPLNYMVTALGPRSLKCPLAHTSHATVALSLSPHDGLPLS